MDLGEFYPCLKVADIEVSISFYEKLGFRVIEDYRTDGWVNIQHKRTVISLYQGHIKENLLNFRGGDVAAIAKAAEAAGLALSMPAEKHGDGSWSAELRDPDGNSIFLNTFPAEREAYLKSGRLIKPLD